jgi:histone H3/H4
LKFYEFLFVLTKVYINVEDILILQNGGFIMSKKKKEVPTEMLIVKSKVKDYAKTLGDFNVSSEFYEEFNLRVAEMVKKAAKRAKQNKRKTIAARDV